MQWYAVHMQRYMWKWVYTYRRSEFTANANHEVAQDHPEEEAVRERCRPMGMGCPAYLACQPGRPKGRHLVRSAAELARLRRDRGDLLDWPQAGWVAVADGRHGREDALRIEV